MNDIFDMADCRVCPRDCGADRANGGRGFCGAGAAAAVSHTMLHEWEEPLISRPSGKVGAVFFAGCNLGCVYCQNWRISGGAAARREIVPPAALADLFLDLAGRDAAAIDLVTPTHFAPQIIEAVKIAKGRGLEIPVVWNSAAYEKAAVVAAIAPDIDVFLPDFKYLDAATARLYSNAPDYPQVALAAIGEMVRAKGAPVYFDAAKTRLKSGVIVRHLVLPGRRKESVELVRTLHERFGDDIILSLLRQYTPTDNPRLAPFRDLQRRLTSFEYGSVVNAAYDAGFRHALVQEKGCADAKYIPKFV